MGRRRGTHRSPANPDLRVTTRARSSRGRSATLESVSQHNISHARGRAASRGRQQSSRRTNSRQRQQQQQADGDRERDDNQNMDQAGQLATNPPPQQQQQQDNLPPMQNDQQPSNRHEQLVDALFQGHVNANASLGASVINTGEHISDNRNSGVNGPGISSASVDAGRQQQSVNSDLRDNSSYVNSNINGSAPVVRSESNAAQVQTNSIQNTNISSITSNTTGVVNTHDINIASSSVIQDGISQNQGFPNFNSIGTSDINMPNALVSICNPLGCELPQALITKIRKGEFVEFGIILGRSEYQMNQTKAMTLSINQGGQIVWQDDKIKRPITSIYSWTTAFLTYASIYLAANPQRSQELLKYAHIIRTASYRFGGYAWRAYDIQFRLRQEKQPQRSWAVIDGELWSLYMTSPFPGRQPQFGMHPLYSMGQIDGLGNQAKTPSSAGNGPLLFQHVQQNQTGNNGEKFCFGFNRPQGCFRKNCNFKHACLQCNNADHGAFACKKA